MNGEFQREVWTGDINFREFDRWNKFKAGYYMNH